MVKVVMVVLELRDWFARPVKHFTTEGARSLAFPHLFEEAELG